MSNFFVQPAGDVPGMKAIRYFSASFAVLHLVAILVAPAVPATQAILAGVLYLFALGLFWWAIRTNRTRHLSAAFSPDTPEHVVTTGPYRFVRHPFYSSYLLTWAAGVAAAGNLWLLPTFFVAFLLYQQAARTEEMKFSRSPLASLYRRYRETTGCFFPNAFKLIAAIRKDTDAAGLAEYRA
jgi:protein-S-isoprenylcysteine O-methyltransferase Ste14